jgi:hypothetical protein
LARGNQIGSGAPDLESQPPGFDRSAGRELVFQPVEFAFEFCPPGSFSVSRLDDPLVTLGLCLDLSFDRRAFAFGVGDKPSVLEELVLEVSDLLAQSADLSVGQQTGPFQLGPSDAPLGPAHVGLDRAAIGTGAHRGQRDPA